MKPLSPSEERIIERMINDQAFRIAMVQKSHYWFFHYYFGHYIKYITADFQREIFNLTENSTIKNLVITSFRGSAKSTIITLSYIIWSILGEQQKKFPLILGRTQQKAQIHLQAIKKELEQNELLRRDLGPFREESNQWGAHSLILSLYGARISVGSTEQSIRGIRHNQHRPDVMVFDDVEDQESVKTQEGRDKLFEWITGDVLPAGDKNTRMIFIGTPLHADSVLMRLEKIFKQNDSRSVFKRYPILDEHGTCLWPGKFQSPQDISDEKAKCFNDLAWQREYLLEIVQADNQIIKREWIKTYSVLPPTEARVSALAIDPARSQNLTADYTAMVGGKLFGYGKDRRLYIMPDIINARLTTDQLLAQAKRLSLSLGHGHHARVYVEDVAFQGVLIDLLKAQGVPTRSFMVRGQNKESRVISVSSLIELGYIIFPEKGAERLIEQLIGFGTEKHDDLVDALTMLILKIFEDSKNQPRITFIDSRFIM